MRTGIHGNFDTDSSGGLSLEEITIGAFLSSSPLAYATAAIGKWHLGHSHNRSAGTGYHPTWRGYDEYVGVPYSIDMGCTDTALDDAGNPKAGCPATGPANGTPLAIPLYNSTKKCDDARGATCSASILQQPADLTELDNYYGSAAESFFARFGPGGAAAGRPFFAYMPFSHVHVPLSHNKKFQNASKRNNLFADTLLEMDATVGRVVASLKANQLDKSTLVLVVGDNGPWNEFCSHAGSQGPFVGGWAQPASCGAGEVCTGTGKFTTWEGGHREASLAWLPGVVPAGAVSNATMHIVDFFPTIAAFAGLPLPADRAYDGVDQSAVLKGAALAAPGREVLFHQSDANFTAARSAFRARGVRRRALQNNPRSRSTTTQQSGNTRRTLFRGPQPAAPQKARPARSTTRRSCLTSAWTRAKPRR